MSNSVTFNFKKSALFSFAVLVFCLYSEVSFAQEDMRKVESEILKPSDKPSAEITNSTSEGSGSNPISIKSTLNSSKTTAPKKEPGLVGEGKKPESSPSTLNFNIFLYIVDKFKAD